MHSRQLSATMCAFNLCDYSYIVARFFICSRISSVGAVREQSRQFRSVAQTYQRDIPRGGQQHCTTISTIIIIIAPPPLLSLSPPPPVPPPPPVFTCPPPYCCTQYGSITNIIELVDSFRYDMENESFIAINLLVNPPPPPNSPLHLLPPPLSPA